LIGAPTSSTGCPSDWIAFTAFLSIRDAYRVTLHDPALDRRLAVAMAVALDALQSR
jgi:hypothetical protein